jgi:putative hydrolase
MFENVPLFRELAKVMSWTGGPVNWDFAAQTAAAVLATEDAGDAGPGGGPGTAGGEGRQDRESEAEAFSAAVGVAELWLDAVTTLPAVEGPARVLTREEWVRAATTSEGLGVYVEPIAEGMSSALGTSLPEPLRAMGGPMAQAIASMGAMLYGLQTGTIAGHLARQLLGAYDLGVPTLDPRVVATVGPAARRFADDYAFDRTEFRHWLALRECAHRRLFAGVPWLRGHVSGLVRRFAADADLDPSSLLGRFGGMGLDLSNPEALMEVLQTSDAFTIEPTAGQRATLEQLQALVAIIEGWSDTVVAGAAAGRLTALPRIEETVRRRRAEKGPGERFLEQLIGLDLKPADFRLGRSFSEAVVAARGREGLDRAWRRPGWLPTHAELADPSRWLVRMAAEELGSDSA